MFTSQRKFLADVLVAAGKKISPDYKGLISEIPELSSADAELIEKVRPFTMTDRIAQWEYIRSIRYVEAKQTRGAIVECGVWRGGNLALAGMLRNQLKFGREIWAYDTFAGMTAPTEHDQKAIGTVDTVKKFQSLQTSQHNEWCYASLEDVQANFAALVGPEAQLRTVVGPVQETLCNEQNLPEEIALLRLDTDFYDSTKVEMEVLYPRLASGGVLIIDDYGEWAGARKAVDEYFDGQHVWLQRVTSTVRMMIKP